MNIDQARQDLGKRVKVTRTGATGELVGVVLGDAVIDVGHGPHLRLPVDRIERAVTERVDAP